MFDGNLGIGETVTPNIWKLHLTSPLYPGTYDIEAQVVDTTTNLVVVLPDSEIIMKSKVID